MNIVKNLPISFLMVTIFSFISCGSARLTEDNVPGGEPKINTTGLYDSLADHLRKYPGVEVREFGGNDGEVVIRGGTNSLELDKRPLYVVNGSILGRSYKSVNSSINANEVTRIVIKKSLSETNTYGASGRNGVIEITTKSVIN